MCSADVLNKNNIPRDAKHPRTEQEDALYNHPRPSASSGWHLSSQGVNRFTRDPVALVDQAVATFALWHSGKLGKELTE